MVYSIIDDIFDMIFKYIFDGFLQSNLKIFINCRQKYALKHKLNFETIKVKKPLNKYTAKPKFKVTFKTTKSKR